jgi:mRNA-degrading endonuclease RelE of RelBE toxin-antitoxin system
MSNARTVLIRSSIESAGNEPLRFDQEGCWSARRGQYRVIYSSHDDHVLVRVVRIAHRADAYG